ncbi:hypothetical protein EYR40_009088 [Pleurotus pulmonarius]|nr:hypothetical protein EYR36_009908 [Pleurotus pulmonarius]KAF4594285.1 hypothetical protein EYR40_009088 [Pleurotus pulmonarius]
MTLVSYSFRKITQVGDLKQWALTIVDTFEFLEATRYMSLAQIRDGPPLLYTGHHKSAKFALHIVQTLLGNCFLIHRLYIVWNRRLIMIIAPTMLILANFAFGVLGLVPFVNFSLPILALSVMYIDFVACLSHPSYFALLSVNFIITVMIAIKVWMMNRASSTHRRILCTAVESAGLYTLFVILSLVSLFISGDSLSSLLSTQGPIIGISVCSIILLDAYRSEDAQTTPLLRHDEDSASSAESESRVDVTV